MKTVDRVFCGMIDDSFKDTKAFELLESKVILEYCLSQDGYKSWIGTHKNVVSWVITEDRYAIAFNENPAIGWSFPVIKLGKKRFEKLTGIVS